MGDQSAASYEHFFLFFRLLYLSTRFLSVMILESSVIHYILLANLFRSFFRPFLCAFLDDANAIMNKPCHVPRASRITTSGKFFMEIPIGVSKE